MNRNQVLCNGHLSPSANAAKVVGITKGQDATAVGFGALDTKQHRFVTDHLPKTAVTV